MKQKTALWCVFAAAGLLSGALGWLLYRQFGIVPVASLLSESLPGSTGPGSIPDALLYALHRLQIPCLMFLSAFTLYAPAFCFVSSCYAGWLYGDFARRMWDTFAGSGAAWIGFLLGGCGVLLYGYLSLTAVENRRHLRHAVPDVRTLLGSSPVRRCFGHFAAFVALMLSLSFALYYTVSYFPPL